MRFNWDYLHLYTEIGDDLRHAHVKLDEEILSGKVSVKFMWEASLYVSGPMLLTRYTYVLVLHRPCLRYYKW